MEDPNVYREIAGLGEGEEEPEIPRRGNPWPLVQALVCIGLLLTLAVMKFFFPAQFHRTADWYREEMAREIQLPGPVSQEEESGPSQEAPDQTPQPELGGRESV